MKYTKECTKNDAVFGAPKRRRRVVGELARIDSGSFETVETSGKPALLASGSVLVHGAGRRNLVEDRADLLVFGLGGRDILHAESFEESLDLLTDALLSPFVSGVSLLVLSHAFLG